MTIWISAIFFAITLAFALLAYATRDLFAVGMMVALLLSSILMDAWSERRKLRRKMKLP